MPSRVVSRLASMKPSATMALAQRARDLAKAGRPIVSLTAGEPDQNTPSRIRLAAHQAMDRGDTHYTGAAGHPELRIALRRMLAGEDVELEDDSCVLPTPGAKQAIFYALMALVEEGTGVLLPEPCWVSYKELTELAEGTPIPVGLDPGDHFRLTAGPLIDAARAAGGAKVMILCSPSNPTGRVFTSEEIDAVVEVATTLDLTVISDEIYGRLVYPPCQFVRMAADPRLAGRVVTVDGFSKAYAMTGWRLGWVAGPKPIVKAMTTLQMHTATCPAAFVQTAGVTALEACADDVVRFAEAYARRRQLIVEHLSGIPGLRVPPIEGAFYAFLDFRAIEPDDVAMCERLLSEADLALVPGSAFGAAGKGFLRLSFAAEDGVLVEACARIRKVLSR